MTAYWRARPDGVSVSVKVQPRSRRPGVQGLGVSALGPCLRVGVTEAAEDGRANKAVCALMASVLSVPVGSVSVLVGHASRDKTLCVTGDAAALGARLAGL